MAVLNVENFELLKAHLAEAEGNPLALELIEAWINSNGQPGSLQIVLREHFEAEKGKIEQRSDIKT